MDGCKKSPRVERKRKQFQFFFSSSEAATQREPRASSLRVGGRKLRQVGLRAFGLVSAGRYFQLQPTAVLGSRLGLGLRWRWGLPEKILYKKRATACQSDDDQEVSRQSVCKKNDFFARCPEGAGCAAALTNRKL